jgi:hypothetical protein
MRRRIHAGVGQEMAVQWACPSTKLFRTLKSSVN